MGVAETEVVVVVVERRGVVVVVVESVVIVVVEEVVVAEVRAETMVEGRRVELVMDVRPQCGILSQRQALERDSGEYWSRAEEKLSLRRTGLAGAAAFVVIVAMVVVVPNDVWIDVRTSVIVVESM